MGRKGQLAQMGRSLLVKDTKRRHGRRKNVDNFVHTSDIQNGTSYNRINFQSVTEQSHLEDFLNKAEMAGRDFTAERQNISVITDPAQGIRLTADDVKKISNAQQQHKELLRIPRRPFWDEFTSKEELLLLERDTFTEWRRQLNELEEQEHIELTPYEKNLDFWRQLWRVIERSDVVVQIVDARNPLLFRCEDLELYINEVNQDKVPMLLVNKADYLNHQQRLQWVEFFNKQGIQAVFFSAKKEAEKHAKSSEDDQGEEKLEESMDTDSEEEDDDDDDDDDDEDCKDEMEDIVEENEDRDSHVESTASCSSPSNTDTKEYKSTPTPSDCDNVDLKSMSIKDSQSLSASGSNSSEDKNAANISNQDQVGSEKISTSAVVKDNTPCDIGNSGDKTNSKVLSLENSPDIVTADELLDILRKLAHPSATARSGDVKTIGMVGYPNVGKSSTINVILKQKKLAVSVTPGRTKHLQTLYVDDTLMLCDCPGLVFPSFITTKAHLVINGILPIDELHDHVSPSGLVCDHIPRRVLEATYGIMIPRPSVDEDPNRPVKAEELLNAYGAMRGFMTQRGIPDGSRAARYLLKDYVKGKLLFCNPPPGISAPDFQDETLIIELEANRPVIKVPLPQIKSEVDKEFFQKRLSNVHSSGVRGVKNYVRVDCLKQTSSIRDADGNSGDGSVAGSSMSLNSVGVCGKKSWKQNKNKKKEKLRKTNRDLDLH